MHCPHCTEEDINCDDEDLLCPGHAEGMAALHLADLTWTNTFNQLFALADFTIKPGTTAAQAGLVRQALDGMARSRELGLSAGVALAQWTSAMQRAALPAVVVPAVVVPVVVDEDEDEDEDEEEDEEVEEVAGAVHAAHLNGCASLAGRPIPPPPPGNLLDQRLEMNPFVW